MLDSLLSSLHLVLGALGLISSPELGSLGALGLTVAVVSAAIVAAAVLALALPDAAPPSLARPVRGIDASSPLAQSDPDAAGHPRPRAPGFAAAAA
ncbi:DUF6412 domain-containing protein [Microbacterium deminutum]|uniref:Uncharacterized protein n=1 Tax=Microbacterium deminutum TaxID=344164 RepID=A0ABP5CHE8_9MICO